MSRAPWSAALARGRAHWATWDARRRGLALVVAASLLLAIGAWGASLAIESPREAAANASAPPPSLITVPVEKRRVGEEIVTRGTVSATQTVEAVSELAGNSAGRALVSGRVPQAGEVVDHGSVVIEISGRPVIALRGAVPAYRDLGPGDSGSDVRQLNAALAGAGHPTDAKSSAYDDTTRRAVDALYRAAGYSSTGSLPIGEVAFVSALPASVIGVTADLGTPASDTSVQIASGELAVITQFTSAAAGLVRPGAEVVVSSELLGKSAEARVEDGAPAAAEPEAGETSSADASAASESARASARSVRIVPLERLGSEWAGQDVKVRVVSAETTSAVLAVPVTAVVANGSGDTEVVVVRRGATTISDADPRRVRVTVGVTGGGWAEVTPVDDAELSVGDPVQLSAPEA